MAVGGGGGCLPQTIDCILRNKLCWSNVASKQSCCQSMLPGFHASSPSAKTGSEDVQLAPQQDKEQIILTVYEGIKF